MAWSNSKIFSAFVTDCLNNTAALDLNSDALKAALFDNSITPSQSAATASTLLGAGVWASGQLSNGGWTSGGLALASVASGFSSNVYTFDAADTANVTDATISGAFGTFVYDDTTADQGISYHYFGGTQSVTAGTFTIVWNASGIFALTL